MNSGKTLRKLFITGTVAAGLLAATPAISETPVFAASINTHQILKAGDHGHAVSKLQKKLDHLHYYNNHIDGIYGPITRGSVKDYQQDHGLKVDGIAGPHTLSSLFKSHSHSSKRPSETLSIGDHGKNVKNLQSKLKSLGYYTYKIDGIFGHITKQGVQAFQKDHGLKVDGIAGPNTYDALYGKSGKKVVSASESNSSTISNIISDAKSLVGTPYEWGGDSPSGFDCSGFVQYVFGENGVDLPRTTSAMWDTGKNAGSPEPGDLVFFETYKSGPSHVGIYIGHDKFIEAGTSHGVTIADMNMDYWKSRYLGAKSVL